MTEQLMDDICYAVLFIRQSLRQGRRMDELERQMRHLVCDECGLLVKGAPSNWNLAARFDLTEGHLGIVNFDGPKVTDRVLLSPGQVRELRKFLRERRP